ncbi:MAG: hypothetical protein VX438_07620, partial [Planctomycetota bacterium]|nr:hypothetical protein [Planctomycetota bacterium]
MNNLTQREKVLIYSILGILPLVLLFFGFNWFMGQLKTKSNELQAVSQQLADIELRAEIAQEKTLLQNQFKQRSLSSQVNVAQGEYREWLRNLVENELKFKGTPQVKSRGNVSFKSDFGDKPEIFQQLSFQLDCTGSYQQIVDLLYRFYEKNYIHRITRLDLNLNRSKREGGKVTYDRSSFMVKIQIQVLSLVDADEERTSIAVDNTKLFFKDPGQEKHIHQLEDYYAVILRRNLFGFPNNAPDFGSRKKEFDFEEGDRISVRLSADDEDDDSLQYVLQSTDGKVTKDLIESSRAGSFKIDIRELGQYKFLARVTDENYYPKTDEMQVVVNIDKKPPPKPRVEVPRPPKFDALKFTTLEAIVSNFDGIPVCWINVRPYGKMHKVSQGAEFSVGQDDIKIIKINRRNAVIAINGDQHSFEVNQTLGQSTRTNRGSERNQNPKDDDPKDDDSKDDDSKDDDS